MRVLDLGGWAAGWEALSGHPGQVISLNLGPEVAPNETWIRCLQGDACSPPADLLRETFDLVYCNSLIEHVGGHERRKALAGVIRAMAPHHWVQTPYRYFPLEPHWLFPGFQFLPLCVQVTVSSTWPLGHMSSATRTEAVEDVLSVSLLNLTEMKHYFPDSEMVSERFLGLTKSLIAVR